jgi:hypothetical protein
LEDWEADIIQLLPKIKVSGTILMTAMFQKPVSVVYVVLGLICCFTKEKIDLK